MPINLVTKEVVVTDGDLIKWLLGMLATFIGSVVTTIAWMRGHIVRHAERIANLEAKKVLTESEVRKIVKSEMAPIKETLDDIRQDTKTHTEVLTDLRVVTTVLVEEFKERKHGSE